MSPDLVIFDCDGVLVDSEALYARIDAEMLAEVGYHATPAQISERFAGIAFPEMLAMIERELGRALPDGYAEAVAARTGAAFETELRPIPHVRATVEALERPVCVASSTGPSRLHLSLRVTGLIDLFAPDIFSATQVARGKPAPDLFLFAAAQMGASPDGCLVIEDSVPGVTAAVAAGMPVLGFSGASHGGTALADRLRQAGAATVFDDMRVLSDILEAL
jgi:HAD superfamily hydrolase (TIGR01509 family)